MGKELTIGKLASAASAKWRRFEYERSGRPQ